MSASVSEPLAADERDLRFGWLEAFVAVAHHGSHEAAGFKLGLDPSTVQRSHEKLEAWMHRILLLDGALTEPYGKEFLPVAKKILNTLFDISSISCKTSTDTSHILLSDMKAFIALEDSRNYKDLASHIGCSEAQARRKVHKVDSLFYRGFIKDRSRIKLTSSGEAIINAFQQIVEDLEGSKSSIQLARPAELNAFKVIRALFINRKVQLLFFIDNLRKRGKLDSKGIAELQAAQDALAWTEKTLAAVEPFAPNPSGKDIVV